MGSEPWPEGVDLRVRVALHTGEAVLRDARNYTGPSIHRCARLRRSGMAPRRCCRARRTSWWQAACPTASACVTSVRIGCATSRGRSRCTSCATRNYATTSRRCARCQPSRTTCRPAHQLRRPRGRDRQRLESCSADRPCALTGAGGSGKHGWPCQVAAETLDDHPDGVWWVVRRRSAIRRWWPARLRARFRFASSLAAGDRHADGTALRAPHVDRTRQLRAPAERVRRAGGDAAEACPGVVIFATSRESLGVEGEQSWRLPRYRCRKASSPQPRSRTSKRSNCSATGRDTCDRTSV